MRAEGLLCDVELFCCGAYAAALNNTYEVVHGKKIHGRALSASGLVGFLHSPCIIHTHSKKTVQSTMKNQFETLLRLHYARARRKERK
jgi:hypothetical protein